jgi:hypothetical protein
VGGGHWRFGGWITWRSPGLELNDMGFLRQADVIQQVAWAGYRIWEPFSIFRRLNVNAAQWSGWDFSGLNLYRGGNVNINMQFKNYWRFATGVNREGENITRHELRGGKALMLPGSWGHWLDLSTDERKKLTLSLFMYNGWGDDNYSRSFDLGIELSYRPLEFLQISLEPAYFNSNRNLIYIDNIDYEGSSRYLVSSIKREMASANIRINVSITPDLSIQYWGQPFVFSGEYYDFKRILDQSANEYNDQFHCFTSDELVYDGQHNQYLIDEFRNGQIDYTFDNPDFSFFEFRSNLVLRWEYIPGSTLYFVWSQGRSGDHEVGEFDMLGHVNRLSDIKPRNVFLLKFSYRFSF